LDRHSHSGTATVDVSADRGPAAGSAGAAQLPGERTGKARADEDGDRRSNVAIFLTGSTGYIGAHVAANLLDTHGAALNVLVRGKDAQDSALRLSQAPQFHIAFARLL